MQKYLGNCVKEVNNIKFYTKKKHLYYFSKFKLLKSSRNKFNCT